MKFSPLLLIPFLLQVATAAVRTTTVSTSLTNSVPSNLCSSYITSGGQGASAWHATAEFYADSTNGITLLGTGVRNYKYIVQWYFSFDSPLGATDFDVSCLTSLVSTFSAISVTVNTEQGAFILSYNDTVTYPVVLGVDLLSGYNCFDSLIGFTLSFKGGDTSKTIILGSSLFWLNPVSSVKCILGSMNAECIALTYPAFTKCVVWNSCKGIPPSPSVVTQTRTSVQTNGCTAVDKVQISAFTYKTVLFQENTYFQTLVAKWVVATRTIFFIPFYSTSYSTHTYTKTQTVTQTSLVPTYSMSTIAAVTLCPSSSAHPALGVPNPPATTMNTAYI
ncbi:hypothetical protein BABINDRAFT_159706 [Babjeviella inositovora NRRL Y-12698]|uniref:Flo11 domain-containing protein n=1 Tax=Babjeviella inositovora NRRL Y-12698 TaxID=984486 RepID=A0A1E3R0D6_9ASCO|nr:uncharacterized protein BABINDRAFT_159706 [Babjeviella inositovora NRRL Y-12698]ODQ83274.1 hypothetical protein BABINDRAFT_159706 [Babjeviella inositovora NRRL Y-12698]